MTVSVFARLLGAVALAGLLPGAGPAAAQSGPPAPMDTVEVGLTETVVRALEESPEVDQRQAQKQFATARSEEARANRFLTDVSLDVASSFAPGLDIPSDNEQPDDALYLNPNVENDWSIGALRPFGRAEIAVQQPLWTWGELSGSIEAARRGVDVEAARVEQKALEVAVRAGETYYGLILTEALDRLADRTQEVIDRAKREINRLLDEGDEGVSQSDLFQTRLTEEETKRRIVEIEQNQKTARSALRRQLFLSDRMWVEPAADELQPLSFAIHPDSLDYYIGRALQNRPEVEQAEAGVEARRALVDVARSDYYPTIGVQATLSQSITLPERPNPDNAFVGDSFMGTGTRSGIGIQQNLNFGQTRARVEQAEAELDAVQYQRTAAEQLVRFEVEEAYRSLLTAKAAVESRDRSTTIAGEWLRTEQVNFDLDLGNTEDLVKAVRADLQAQAQYLRAVRRYNVAVLDLLRATGTLADRARSGTLLETRDDRE
ncbi:outer membrane protein TolC [Salinibacter ruber]|uniref:TolC family protein n=1 Tax=Salinibacter ruber TaxID=146919 RepID=UPI0021699E31|nr:TolC family protein [Salinibacter ruber]MCS3939645.1 outer membrane protein TolC [Salinibacter ruber]